MDDADQPEFKSKSRVNPGPLRQVLAVFGLVWIATAVLVRAERFLPLEGLSQGAIAALYLYLALRMAKQNRDPSRHGIDLGGLLAERGAGDLQARDLIRSAAREGAFALLIACLILPPFVVGFVLLNDFGTWRGLYLPPDPVSFAAAQWLAVGIPEEALFRGYFQTRLGDVWPRRSRWFGVEISWGALVVSSLMFAAVHFTELDPTRLAVVFPSLLFGWVREKRGGIGASAALHALCNIASETLFRTWIASS